MKTIQQLQDDLLHAVRTAEDIRAKADKESRTLTKEEAASVDALLAECKEHQARIDEIEADHKRGEAIKAQMEQLRAAKPTATSRDGLSDKPATESFAKPKSYRFGKLKAFTGPTAEDDAFLSGQWLRATILGDYRAQRWCANHMPDYRAAQSEGVNTAGGFLVPTQLEQTIIDLREQYGVFRQNTTVMPMSSEVAEIPRRSSGLTAYFTGEATAITDSTAGWDLVRLNARKIGVLSHFSSELDEDAVISIADNFAREAAYAMALKEDQCGFLGDGTSTYGLIRGVLPQLEVSGMAGRVVAASGHDTFAEVDATDIAKLIAGLPAYALPGAKFFCSSVAKAIVFDRLLTGAGGNTMVNVGGNVVPSYNGYPIIVSQVLPSTQSTINLTTLILFGDLSMASIMGQRRGVTLSRTDALKFAEDQVSVKATERFDINVHGVGNTSTAGAIVALIGTTA